MNHTLQKILAGLLLCTLFAACTIQKRRYQPGYSVEWNHSKPVAYKKEATPAVKPVIPAVNNLPSASQSPVIFHPETFTASAEQPTSATATKKKKARYHYPKLSAEDCDVILLKNGDEIKAIVTQVMPDEIKYKKCGDAGGTVYTVKKSDVFMINYINGTKDVLQGKTKADKYVKPETEDKGLFGIISFVSLIAFILLIDTGTGLGALLFLLAAIILGIIGLQPGRKLKGLALAGLIGSILLILLILLVAATWDGL